MSIRCKATIHTQPLMAQKLRTGFEQRVEGFSERPLSLSSSWTVHASVGLAVGPRDQDTPLIHPPDLTLSVPSQTPGQGPTSSVQAGGALDSSRLLSPFSHTEGHVLSLSGTSNIWTLRQLPPQTRTDKRASGHLRNFIQMIFILPQNMGVAPGREGCGCHLETLPSALDQERSQNSLRREGEGTRGTVAREGSKAKMRCGGKEIFELCT